MLRLVSTTFDQAVSQQAPVVVKFYADWCHDCRRIASTYSVFAQSCSSLSFAEVDTEQSPDLAGRFDVRGIPAIVVFRDGTVVDRIYSREARYPAKLVSFLEQQCMTAAST